MKESDKSEKGLRVKEYIQEMILTIVRMKHKNSYG